MAAALSESAMLEARRVSSFRERLLELDASLSALAGAALGSAKDALRLGASSAGHVEPLSRPAPRTPDRSHTASLLFSPNDAHSTRSGPSASSELGVQQRRPPSPSLPQDIQAIMLRHSFDKERHANSSRGSSPLRNAMPLTQTSLVSVTRMPQPTSASGASPLRSALPLAQTSLSSLPRMAQSSSAALPPHVEDPSHTSAAIRPVATYSEDFIQELQRQHKSRIDEMQESAQQLLRRKEEEITLLTERFRDLQNMKAESDNRSTDLERMYEQKLSELLKRETKQEIEVQHFARKQAETYEEDLSALKQRYEREIEKLIMEHKDEMERKLHEARRQAELKEQAMCENFRTQHELMEQTFAEKLKESQTQYLAHISDLHRCLNQESQRLTTAREDLTSSAMAHRNEIMAQQVRIDELLRDAAEREKVHSRALNKLQDELAHATADFKKKEMDYQTLLRFIRQEAALEKEQQAALLVKKERRIEDLSARVKELTAQQSAWSEQVEHLNTSLDKNHLTTQKHIQQNKDLCELVRTLQRDLSLAQSELSLGESELNRLRNENSALSKELQRLDQILYGSKPRKQR